MNSADQLLCAADGGYPLKLLAGGDRTVAGRMGPWWKQESS